MLQSAERAQQAKFDAQPADEAATGATQKRVELAAKAATGTRRAQVQCHKSMCRLESEHESNAAFLRFYQAEVVDLRTAWRGSVAYVRVDRSPAGTVTAVAFLGPEKSQLPQQVTADTRIRGCATTVDCTSEGPGRAESPRKPPEAP